MKCVKKCYDILRVRWSVRYLRHLYPGDNWNYQNVWGTINHIERQLLNVNFNYIRCFCFIIKTSIWSLFGINSRIIRFELTLLIIRFTITLMFHNVFGPGEISHILVHGFLRFVLHIFRILRFHLLGDGVFWILSDESYTLVAEF